MITQIRYEFLPEILGIISPIPIISILFEFKHYKDFGNMVPCGVYFVPTFMNDTFIPLSPEQPWGLHDSLFFQTLAVYISEAYSTNHAITKLHPRMPKDIYWSDTKLETELSALIPKAVFPKVSPAISANKVIKPPIL